MNKTGLNIKELLKLPKVIITTLGEQGSRISTAEGDISIPAVKTDRVKDPTGAGDSYRGGLISGLISGKDIERCARLGSVCASFAVECYGTQEYSFTTDEFDRRLNI